MKAKKGKPFDPQQKAKTLKSVKIVMDVPATADIATTKQDLTNVGRLFERVITQEAQVILEVHYNPAQAKEDEDNPEETLHQELQPSFEALKERLLRAVDGSPPWAADVRMEFVKDNPSDEQDGGGHGGRIRDRWHVIVLMRSPPQLPAWCRAPRRNTSYILVLCYDTNAVVSRCCWKIKAVVLTTYRGRERQQTLDATRAVRNRRGQRQKEC